MSSVLVCLMVCSFMTCGVAFAVTSITTASSRIPDMCDATESCLLGLSSIRDITNGDRVPMLFRNEHK